MVCVQKIAAAPKSKEGGEGGDWHNWTVNGQEMAERSDRVRSEMGGMEFEFGGRKKGDWDTLRRKRKKSN